MNLFRLGGSAQELEAAVILAAVRGVLIEAAEDTEGADRLLANGFVKLPRTIETALGLPFDVGKRARSFRRNLARSLRVWDDAGARVVLLPVAEADPTLLNRLYFDIVVPMLYVRGRSPFGIHNQRAFRALLHDEAWVAFVMSGDQLLGGSILTSRTSPDRRRLAGAALSGSSLTGKVYALDDGFAEAGRAFLAKQAEAAAERGFRSLSLGIDLPWMQAPYAAVLIEKLGWADTVLFDSGPLASWANFERCGEDILYFRKSDTGLELCSARSLEAQMRRIEQRIVDLMEP